MAHVTDKDFGYKRAIKSISALGGRGVAAGMLANSGKEKDGADLVDVAIWNEYGTKHIPSRPFLRQATDKNLDKWLDLSEKLAGGVLDGRVSPQQLLNLVGVRAKADIQNEIRDGDFVPNAPATIRRKGSSQPLIDTGRMRQSINYRIEG